MRTFQTRSMIECLIIFLAQYDHTSSDLIFLFCTRYGIGLLKQRLKLEQGKIKDDGFSMDFRWISIGFPLDFHWSSPGTFPNNS